MVITCADGTTALGTGPAGRPLDDGRTLRTASRRELARARPVLLARLRADVVARRSALAAAPPAARAADGGSPWELPSLPPPR
ncbi:hypothetical protein ACWKWC_04635 [Geodermatophilus nigrescens]